MKSKLSRLGIQVILGRARHILFVLVDVTIKGSVPNLGSAPTSAAPSFIDYRTALGTNAECKWEEPA